MEIHEKYLFEMVLTEAVERFSERIVQRCEGVDKALKLIKEDCEAEGIWLSQFVDNYFKESLLNNTAGAVFILSSLEKRKVSGQYEGNVKDVLEKLSQEVFSEIVKKKTIESLERSMAYGGS